MASNPWLRLSLWAQEPVVAGRRVSRKGPGWAAGRSWRLMALCAICSLVTIFCIRMPPISSPSLSALALAHTPAAVKIGRRLALEQPGTDGQANTESRPVEAASRTLSFTVCNGFANQRLALVNGMVLAKELNRAVVLPSLIANGRQDDPAASNYGDSSRVDMSAFYNTTYFMGVMECLGLRFASEAAAGSEAYVAEENTEAAIHQQPQEDHLQFGCPLFRLGPQVILRNEDFVLSTLNALTPNNTITLQVEAAAQQLQAMSKTGNFNFLHLRLESDWVAHCSSWKFGLESDNCFTNTLSIDEHLKDKVVDTVPPIYVAFDSEAVFKPVMMHVLNRLHNAGYEIVTRHDLLLPARMPRELAALVDYSLALHAHKFIGNSVSTFSALIILERERRGAWASHYNMGDIPLAAFMPLYEMPWVFTYNGHSPSVDYMIKSAVVSGKQARLKPFCLYNGTQEDPMYRWLLSNGVSMILHTPQWFPTLQKLYPAAMHNSQWSPLYNSLEALFGTFQRIDIPIVLELEQYNYVLFTDADVVFERVITLQCFPQPLPTSIALADEFTDGLPCNAGVALMNLPFLRRSYKEFIAFVFTNPSLHYGQYGPADQGALNQFYADSMDWQCSLTEAFNARPHRTAQLSHPFIVHFHGPKPLDYLAWGEGGTCSYGPLCARGFQTACKVMARHHPGLPSCDLHAISPLQSVLH